MLFKKKIHVNCGQTLLSLDLGEIISEIIYCIGINQIRFPSPCLTEAVQVEFQRAKILTTQYF